MDDGERVGMFIVTIRSTDRDDARWTARIKATTDVERSVPRPKRPIDSTIESEIVVGSLRAWLAEFETGR